MKNAVVKQLISVSRVAAKIGIKVPVAVENSTYIKHVGTVERVEGFLREAYVHLLGATLSNRASGWFLSETYNGDIVEVPFTRDSTGFLIGNQSSMHT